MNITVVVPVYNAEKYLNICIDSLINQTRKAYEIILIDDGSKDSSGKICDEYAKQEDNIRVVHKENEGLGLTRNCGIREANGDYITFIDSDDFCDADYLETLENIMLENKCDTCKATFKRVGQDGEYLYGDDIYEGVFKGTEVKNSLLPRFIGSAPDKNDSIPMSSCCTLYSMEIIKKHELSFVSEREWISEDILFNLEYYAYAQNVIVSNYQGYNYRINQGSLTRKYLAERFQKSIDLCKKEAEILEDLGMYSFCKERLSRQFFVYTRMCLEQLKVSDLSSADKKQEIKIICENTFLQKLIKEYPLNQIGFKQKVFLVLIQKKQVMILNKIYG